MIPLPFTRLLAGALLVLSLPHPLASDTPAETAKIVHKATFVRTGEASLHCACITTRGGCDTKLQHPLAAGNVHQWWQIVQVETGKPVDVASACWRKRDVPAHGDALCCSPTLNQDGDPIPRELRKLYGATSTREPSPDGTAAR